MTAAVELRAAKMNSLEQTFAAEWLVPLFAAKEIQWWEFEPMRFRLGGSAFYRPDFVVVDRVGQVLAYETKGHWREASRARIRVAAERFPWVRFVGVKRDRRGTWNFEEFDPGP